MKPKRSGRVEFKLERAPSEEIFIRQLKILEGKQNRDLKPSRLERVWYNLTRFDVLIVKNLRKKKKKKKKEDQ